MATNVVQVSHSAIKSSRIECENHSELLKRSEGGQNAGLEHEKADSVTQWFMDGYVSSFYHTGNLDVPLNYKLNGVSLDAEFACIVSSTDAESGNKRRARYAVRKTIKPFIHNANRVLMHHATSSERDSGSGAPIADTFSKWSDSGKRAQAGLGIVGTCPSALVFENRCPLMSLQAKAMDFRSVFVKGYYLLHQMSLLYSCNYDLIEVRGDTIEKRVVLAEEGAIIHAASEYESLICTDKMTADQIELLHFLTREWPFQELREKGAGNVDLYSRTCVPADDVLLFTTVNKLVRIQRTAYVKPPDAVYSLLLQLASHLQEEVGFAQVVRELRGLSAGLSWVRKPGQGF